MEPILKKLQKLRAEEDAMEVPDDPHAAMRDAARKWDEAEAAGDIAALRAIVPASRAGPLCEYREDGFPAVFRVPAPVNR
jgi:hypothetical protein